MSATWAVDTYGDPSAPPSPLLVHVPHAGTRIPPDVRAGLSLDDAALDAELAAMTDWHTDALAAAALDHAGVPAVVFRNRLSRLVVDPERFPDDREPMAAVGMGAVYRSTSTLAELRRPDDARDDALRNRYFDPYADALAETVDHVLAACDRCVIVDVHSYPTRALPYELDPTADRPGVCIGTDPAHTPGALAARAAECFGGVTGGTGIDTPFAGTYVPTRHYQADPRVHSVMIEIRRDQYLDEPATVRPDGFAEITTRLAALFAALATPPT